MVFSNEIIPENIIVSINCCNISRVENTKFLGVIIDEKLNWKEHIMRVKNKLNKSISIMYKARQLIDEKSLYILYCSLFLPYMTYCIEVWASTYKTCIKPIFILQKKAVRIICKVAYGAHTHELFIDKKIIKLKDLLKLKFVQLCLRPCTCYYLKICRRDLN